MRKFLHDNTLLMVLLMLQEWLKLSCCNFDIFWKFLSSLPLIVLITQLPLMEPINSQVKNSTIKLRIMISVNNELLVYLYRKMPQF